MVYTKKEHRKNIINGISSSLVVAVFIGVLYDTKSWLSAIVVSLIWGIIAFYISWFLVKEKK